MRKYVIERDLPAIGRAGASELRDAASKSNACLAELGTGIQWLESFVVSDKTFCIYLAEDEALVRRHAELSGFPATTVSEVVTTIDPTTAAR